MQQDATKVALLTYPHNEYEEEYDAIGQSKDEKLERA